MLSHLAYFRSVFCGEKNVPGYWWLAVSCRANASKCVPFVTAGRLFWNPPPLPRAAVKILGFLGKGMGGIPGSWD